MCNAEFSGASIPQMAAVFVVGRVALVGKIALPVYYAGWDTGQFPFIDPGQLATTTG